MGRGRRAKVIRYPALKWALERENIKLTTVASLCGIEAGMFSYRLTGSKTCDFSVQDALKLSKFFGMPISDLFWESEEWRAKNGK